MLDTLGKLSLLLSLAFHQGKIVALDYNVAVGYIEIMRPITYTRAALKALRKMPANAAERIIEKIEQYAAYPALQANNVTVLKGRDGIRLRVGDWRVIMNDEGVVLAVLAIGPRGSIYG
ncbi:type II toxin-antitoxin system RelE family toxin [Sphingobium fluviale]|nr:type II toxin-antitoxin system RelE/ParE family toxin [Sphingobium fluviale]